MPSYLTNLLTTTTSRYDTLRRTLLSSTDERDGDTPDDSHISRVLRAYYAEKSRSLPDWLPPDPRSARPHLQHPDSSAAVSTYQSYSTSARNWIVGGGSTAAAATARPGLAPQASSRRAGGISDLWDRPAASSQASAQATPSLRRGEGSTLRSSGNFEPDSASPPRYDLSSSGQARPTPLQQQQHNYSYNSAPSRLQPAGSRPLPSQRVGTTQQSGSLRGARGGAAPEGDYFGGASATGVGGGGAAGAVPPTPGISAQDRLKARLWGGARPASPGLGRGSGFE